MVMIRVRKHSWGAHEGVDRSDAGLNMLWGFFSQWKKHNGVTMKWHGKQVVESRSKIGAVDTDLGATNARMILKW